MKEFEGRVKVECDDPKGHIKDMVEILNITITKLENKHVSISSLFCQIKCQ